MSDDHGFMGRRLQSFYFAGRGIVTLFETQFHAWIHLLGTFVVVTAGLYFEVSRLEWALLALATGSVWVAEGLNSAIEFAVDLASPEYHELAKKAKDVAAAAVLMAAFTAIAVAALVFLPRVLESTI